MFCPACATEVDVSQGRFVAHGACPGSYAVVELAATTSEARYTLARSECPHPERWHSMDSDSTELEVTALVAAFVEALRPDVVVETGSAFGQTSEAIGRVLAQAKVGELHTIEIDPERAAYTRERCASLPVKVEECSSLDWMPPKNVGFVWFDSELNLRVPEYRRYYSHISKGAIVGFHDTGEHFGLWPEIERLEEEGLLLPIRLRTPRGVVFGEVT